MVLFYPLDSGNHPLLHALHVGYPFRYWEVLRYAYLLAVREGENFLRFHFLYSEEDESEGEKALIRSFPHFPPLWLSKHKIPNSIVSC